MAKNILTEIDVTPNAYNKRHQNAASRLDSQQVARVCGGR
jgi:hypothetical protein